MKKKIKMNGLYKTAFILLMVCIPMFIMSIVVAYALEQIYLSAIFSAGGAFLAFLGIIFATVSKPKKEKPVKSLETDNEPIIDSEFQSDEEFAVDNEPEILEKLNN